MLFVSEHDLVGLLSPQQIVAAVESAVRAQDEGQVVAPPRLHMQWGENTLLAMPSVSGMHCGVKVVSVAPANVNRGLPAVNGLMILSDAESGMPLAIMNGAALTSQRTGGVGALGVKYMTPSDVRSVGIVGCGVQGAWQAVFACAVRSITEVFVFSRSMAGFDTFAATVHSHAPHVRIIPCKNVLELLANTSVVIAATTSAVPVLPDAPDLLENKHFISVGSFKPTMQELPDTVYRLAGHIAIDTEHARREVGDVRNTMRNGLLAETDVFAIAELVTGRTTLDVSRTTAYKSVGAALYDLFVAQAFYLAAQSQGRGRDVSL